MASSSAWKDPSNVIASMAAAMSVLSIVVSLRSCNASESALTLAVEEHNSQRLLILSSEQSEADSIAIKSVNEGVVLQRAVAFFPTPMKIVDAELTEPGHQLSLTSVTSELAREIGNTVRGPKGHVVLIPRLTVPMALRSRYVAKGQAFADQALYGLGFEVIVPDNTSSPTIRFTGLVYISRIRPDDDPKAIVDDAWREALLSLQNVASEKLSPLN